MRSFARLCRSAILSLSAISTALAAYAQQTLRVPQDYSTIQAAINAAHTGDTVSVGPGTYPENLTIDTKEITLISTAGAATTTLDGSHLGPVLTITHTPGIATVISGFTVQNGTLSASSPSPLTAGIVIANAGAQVSNSTFQKNVGSNLGVLHGSLTLTSSSLSTASTAGGSCPSAGFGYLNPTTGVSLFGTSTVLTSAGVPTPSVITGNTIFGDGTRCSGYGVQSVNFGQALTLENNTIRNNYIGIAGDATQLLVIQNLIYDNVNGGLSLDAPSAPPNIEPLTTFVINNTIVNNLTSPDPAFTSPTDIFLDGTVARTAFVNNILVGTTPHPVLTCATATPSINLTPLVFDHNDLYNTTNAPNSTLTGDCLTAIGGSPTSAPGNLSVDPRLTGSTDLHPLAGSPVIDAGNNSAPGLLFDAFSLASRIVTTNAPLLTDFAGNRRIADSGRGTPVVDMGAYEASGTLLLTPTATIFSSGAYTMPGFLLALSGYIITGTGIHPPGTITFSDNGSLYGPQMPDASGIAHGEIVTGSGVYNFQATSNLSDASYAPSTSIAVYVDPDYSPTTTPATTTLTLAPTPVTPVLNQPVTLSIHLGSTTTSGTTTTAGPVPPGAVTLSEGSTLLSSLQPDATGLATYTIPHPSAGSHTYTVTYAGTTDFSSATATTAITVTLPIATSLTARPEQNPIALGQVGACIATVVAASGPAPTGTLTFTDGATPEGAITLISPGEQGIVTLPLYNLSIGVHTLTVTFQPDPGFSPSSGTCTINVGGDATLTTLVSSKNPASTTDIVTYTAAVTRTGAATNPAAPTGSVTISEGITLLASAPLVAGSASSSAALSVSLTNPGIHILTAAYIPATSATFTSSGTLTETITAPPAITTVLSASPNPSTIGQTITLSAAVTSTASLPSPATVTFSDGATSLGSVPLPASGIATLPVSSLTLGTHQLSATVHTGPPDLVRSTSSPVTLQVNGLASTLALAASPQPTAFATAPITLTASLATAAALPAGSSLSGTAVFLDGKLPLGTSSVSADGHATFTLSTLAVGQHTFTASFSGNTLLAPPPSPKQSSSTPPAPASPSPPPAAPPSLPSPSPRTSPPRPPPPASTP